MAGFEVYPNGRFWVSPEGMCVVGSEEVAQYWSGKRPDIVVVVSNATSASSSVVQFEGKPIWRSKGRENVVHVVPRTELTQSQALRRNSWKPANHRWFSASGFLATLGS